MEDSKIIELFFARNEDAIKHTDDTYGRLLYQLADNIVRNGQDAEESVSDTYLKAWDTIPPHRPQYFFHKNSSSATRRGAVLIHRFFRGYFHRPSG